MTPKKLQKLKKIKKWNTDLKIKISSKMTHFRIQISEILRLNTLTL